MYAGVDRRILGSEEINASGRESWGYLSHTPTIRGLAIQADRHYTGSSLYEALFLALGLP